MHNWKVVCTAIILVSLSAWFCGYENVPAQEKRQINLDNYRTLRVEQIEVDGCEYLVFINYQNMVDVMTVVHKGNCKNPIHKKFIGRGKHPNAVKLRVPNTHHIRDFE